MTCFPMMVVGTFITMVEEREGLLSMPQCRNVRTVDGMGTVSENASNQRTRIEFSKIRPSD